MAAHRLLAATVVAVTLAGASAGALAQFGWFGSGRNTPPTTPGAAPQEDKGVLASLISRALSTPATRVSIGAVEGALSSEATIRDIQISDRDGVWLKLDRARIVWRRLALIQRRLEIDELTIGTLDIARKPIPAEGPVAGENEPLLPELPVKVEVKAFRLETLALGEPLLGTAARLSASGNAKLGNDPQDGLSLTFDARRLDRPGTLALRLGLVPQGQRLDLSVKVEEPEGGLIARVGNIPGLPPVTLDIDGRGTLDAFGAKLAFKAGDGIGADGNAEIARRGAGRDVKLDLAARIGGLLPEVAAPIFAGTTKLTGTTTFGDDGAITIPGINLVATLARLDVAGSLRDNNADLTVTAENLPGQAGRTAAGGAEIKRLAFRGRVSGPLASPNVEATLQSEDARVPAGRLGRLEASFKAVPAGKDAAGNTRLTLTGDARATGVVPSDPALARALGDTLTLALRGTADTAGVADVETLSVASPTLTARYTGRLGSEEVRGRASLEAASLRPFSGVAGLALAGAASVAADLEGTPRANRINATIDGRIADFATGLAAVDGLFGGRLGLAGKVQVEPTGGYAFEGLRLTGQNATAQVAGRIAQDSGDLALTAELPDLKRADERLSGRAALNARLTGGLQKPDVAAEIALSDATALGRAIPRLALSLDVKDATGALDGTVKLDGTVDGKEARGGFRVARPAAGGYRLDGLDLSIGSVALRGGVALDPRNLAFGSVSLQAGDLGDLSALLLTQAAGSLSADIALDSTGGRQNARVQARAGQVAMYDARLDRLGADLSLTDIYGRLAVAGRAAIDQARIAGEDISRILLDATGAPDASDISLTAAARGFDLDAKARVVPGDRTRIQLSQFNARRGGQRIGLAEPGSATFGGGTAEIGGLALALGQGRLAVSGKVAPTLDLKLDANRVPLSAADLAVPGLGLSGQLNGEARIGGTAAAPTGTLRFAASGLGTPQTRDARLPPLEAQLVGRLEDMRLVLDGSRVSAGRALDLRIDGAAPLAATGYLDLAVKGQADAAGANAFLRGAARLSGTVELDARVEGTAARPEIRLDAKTSRFATGIEAADALLGSRPTLAGRVRIPPAGGVAVDDLRLVGAALTARVDGAMTPDAADLAATFAVPDLKRADGRLSGRADAVARITGTLARPDIDLRANVAGATALGRPIPRLALQAIARDVLGNLDARVTLDGEVDRRPARGGLQAARRADGTLRVQNLDLVVGSVTAKGGVTLDGANLASGRVTIDAPNLDDLSPLALQKLSGTVRADVTLDSRGGGQGAQIKADALRVNLFGVTVTKADADLRVADIYRRPTIAGRASIDEASVAGERISKVRLDAQGTANASDVTLSALARGFSLETHARVLPGERTRVEIASLTATRGRERLALAAPATVTVVPGGAELGNVAVGLGSGRLTVNGLVGSRLNLRAEAKGVPLSVAEMVSPGLGLGGIFEGEARIEGTPSAPSGEYRARIDGLSAPQIRSLNLGKIDVTATGRLDDGRASIDSTVTAGRAGTIRIGGTVPAGAAGQLDVTVRGAIDAAAATTGLLAAGGRRLTGRVEIDARVGGTLAKPDANGSATLSGGSFIDATQGVNLANIQARVVARGQELAIERAQASTRNGGTINASGRVRLDPAAGFPGEIRIAGQNAELVRSTIATAVVNLNLALSGPLARDPRVAGRIDITSAEVSIPERLPSSLKPLPNTRHKNPTPTTRARLALEGKGKKGGRAAPPFDARLDLVLGVPGSIRVRGRGLNAQLGGSLRLGGTLSKPVANGGFDLQRGTLQVATARLDFTRGKLSFNGDLTPDLDFAANTNSGGAAITVAVSGSANDPSFAFTSSPDLPQDEVLSRLLFNSPSGQLSPFQAVALAQAAQQFSGGDGAFEGLRRSLGLTGVDIGVGPGGLTGGLQRALGDRVSVGVRGGASAAQTGIGVDFRVTDEIKLQGDVTAGGGSSVGVGAQYEW